MSQYEVTGSEPMIVRLSGHRPQNSIVAQVLSGTLDIAYTVSPLNSRFDPIWVEDPRLTGISGQTSAELGAITGLRFITTGEALVDHVASN